MGSDANPELSIDANQRRIARLEETLWVIRARAGDGGAFERLVLHHSDPLYYYLRRLIRQPETALDVHQDVWLEVFRGLNRLRAPEAFRSWLYRIAHDKASRFIGREIRDGQIAERLDELDADEIADLEPTFDAEAVHRALDQLPALLREVLTLHYLRDLSVDEIGIAVGCPVGTVKSRLHHARRAMRLKLKEYRL